MTIYRVGPSILLIFLMFVYLGILNVGVDIFLLNDFGIELEKLERLGSSQILPHS